MVRLGHTNIRVRGAEFPVASQRADRTMHGWEGLASAVVGLVLIGAVAALTTWIGDTHAFQTIRYVLAIASWLAAGLLWSAVWAFVNRLFGGQARLGRHLFILGCCMLALGSWKLISVRAAYAYSMEWLTRYGNHMGIVIICGVVFFHLCTIEPDHPKRFAAAAMLLIVIDSGMVLMSSLQRSGRLADELYMSVILPPTVHQSPDHEVEEFLGSAARLKATVDADHARSFKSDDSDGQ